MFDLSRIFNWGNKSNTGSALDKAEAAIAAKDDAALAVVAEELVSLAYKKSYLAEPLIIVANKLAANKEYIPQAIAIYEHAALSADLKSEIRGLALEGIIKNVYNLTTPTARVDAYRNVAGLAPTGSEIEQKAVSGIIANAPKLPTVHQRVAAYREAVLYAKPGTQLQEDAMTQLVWAFDTLGIGSANAQWKRVLDTPVASSERKAAVESVLKGLDGHLEQREFELHKAREGVLSAKPGTKGQEYAMEKFVKDFDKLGIAAPINDRWEKARGTGEFGSDERKNAISALFKEANDQLQKYFVAAHKSADASYPSVGNASEEKHATPTRADAHNFICKTFRQHYYAQAYNVA